MCKACVIFVQRQSRKQTSQRLICQSGTWSCLDQVENSSLSSRGFIVSSGATFRTICRACRFSKCEQIIKSKMPNDSTEPSHIPYGAFQSRCPSPLPLSSPMSSQMEADLSRVVGALEQLFQDTEKVLSDVNFYNFLLSFFFYFVLI